MIEGRFVDHRVKSVQALECNTFCNIWDFKMRHGFQTLAEYFRKFWVQRVCNNIVVLCLEMLEIKCTTTFLKQKQVVFKNRNTVILYISFEVEK